MCGQALARVLVLLVGLAGCTDILGLDERPGRAAGGGGAGASGPGSGGGASGGGGGAGGAASIPDWAVSWGATEFDAIRGIDVDDDCRVFASGHFSETVDVLGRSFTSAGTVDGLVVSLDVDGAFRWAWHLPDAPGSGSDQSVIGTVHRDGRTFVAAVFAAPIVIMPSGMEIVPQGVDGLVLELDDRGTPQQWAVITGAGSNQPRGLTEVGGELALVMHFSNELNLDQVHVASTPDDLAVATFDAGDLAVQTSFVLDNGTDDEAVGIAASAVGQLFVSGYTNDDVEPDGFVGRVSPSWLHRLSGPTTARAFDVAVGPDDTVYVAATISGTTTFDAVDLGPTVGQDAMLLALGPDGSVRWFENFAVSGSSFLRQVAVGPDGTIAVAGYVSGEVDFGGGVLSGDDRDIVVALFDADGNHLGSDIFRGEEIQQTNAIANCGSGAVVIAGQFIGTLTIRGFPLTAEGLPPDAFVARVTLPGGSSR